MASVPGHNTGEHEIAILMHLARRKVFLSFLTAKFTTLEVQGRGEYN